MKIGLFGGSFNPVHIGHLRAAEIFCQKQELDSLYVVPAHVSPFKTEKDSLYVSDADRLNMARLCFSHLESGTKVNVSDMEISRGGTSYTINTVRALRELYPEENFFLLIGGDMLFSFDKWYKYESLLKETKVCAAARDGDSLADMMEYANELGRIKVLPTQAVEMSSTQVREAAAAGQDISGMVPQGVAEYIREKGLYK